ncbi:zinc fingers and homeoboxes protein 3 isoform X1 [Fundulus heteroclitus]|uniref:zinc fingers and homeoboxes protein 3 isoform X1 n=1 Tax=Fundulus heteroclitus TaxID=8078 RepID=UPI00165B0436|nr:zinc fingers and homeoboxes protein 3 isoform X1 [Fundulus heteroclitus]XP_035988686.1 zinc fingers and homeoboxes protein 3 isoform X1 [Fundulus heteroclitus]
MASKRKSTTPCMIPSKVIRSVEEAERDSPVPLRHPRVSGGDRRSPLAPSNSIKPEAGDIDKDSGGTYTCKPCNFETLDLNLFLDHVYTGHPDFRADPGFVCMSCGVSSPKFEGLALHNARVHPSTLNTTLQLRKRDRRVVVEQNLVIGAEVCRDSEISITKTPIMRMLKGKCEAKRIVVSHPVNDEAPSDTHSLSISRESERKESAAVTVAHVPTIVHNGTSKTTLASAIQIVNGSAGLPLLKTPITQVVSVAQNRSLHHAAPITASTSISSASSSSSSQNLPKVMIPLSSIPTYSAAMDSSSFLKTSFSKFPYPTKAELCYLTVVTKFPEEQIKIWFTAQRLKQGISWSPEEIEEARRKMFNTIIQTAPVGSQGQSQSHHGPAPHTITVLPASLGPTGIPQFLQGSLVSQGGVIVTQPVVANGIQVSSAPVALAVTPKPQAAARPMMQARPAAAPAADKGTGVVVGTAGSGSGGGAGSNIVPSSKAVTSSAEGGAINLSLGNGSHSNTKVSGVNGKHSGAEAPSSDRSSSDAKNADVKPNSAVQTDSKTPTDSKTVISSSDTPQSKDPTGGSSQNNSASPATEEPDPSACDSPGIKTEEPSSGAPKSSSPSPAVAPGSGAGSRTPSSAFLDPSFYKGKKSQEQLSVLKDSFLVKQWPDPEEVERLIGLTGLTVREVRKWFSDRRYHFRNCKSSRSGTGGQSKSSAASGSSASPVDLSEGSSSNSGAKTPQHSSRGAAQSPPPTHTPTSPTNPSRRLFRLPSPDFTAVRYKERDPHQVITLEASFAQNADPSGEEVDRLRSETKMTRREIHGWFAEKRKRVAAEKKKEEAEQAPKEDEEMEVDGEERQKDDGSGEPKVNPIKINLKMLKVTEASGKTEGEALINAALQSQPAGTPASSPSPTSSTKPPQAATPAPKTSHSPKPTTARGKKTAEQLHLLKQVYARTQWPSATQYDELISGTGLPRPEVVRWFGDSRYVQKNGQLKWLEEYQNMALEEELQTENAKILQDHLRANGSLEDPQLKELAEKTGLTSDLVRHWFSTRAATPDVKQGAAHRTGPVAAAEPAAPSSAGSSPLEPQPGGGTEEKMEQSVCGVATEAQEANGDGSAAEGTEGVFV